MTESTESRSELYLRFSHRTMVVLFFLVVSLGAASLAMALRPDGAVSYLLAKAPWFVPVSIAVIFGALQRTLRGQRWNPDSPEAKAILQDEWRRTTLDRATRVALIVVLIAQLPLGLLLTPLPTLRAVMAMAVSTITLGIATVIGLFLFFGRDVNDGR
jgi:hypothetical protein